MAKQTFTTGQVLTAAQMTSLQQTAMLGGAASAKTASYTLVAADAGTAISMSNASATTITVNTGLFAAGDTVQITNLGAGVCTITAGTATVNTSASLALAQYESGTLDFTSTSAAIFIKGAGAAAGGGADYTLINTGGTTLAGSASVTVSGISGKNSLFIFTEGDFDADANAVFTLRFNSDTGSNYSCGVFKLTSGSPFATNYQVFVNNQSIPIGNQGTGATCYGAFYMQIDGCNATGIKPFQFTSVVEASSAANASISYNGTGRYKGTSAISSVTFISSAGNFSAGTIYVFGA